jgi:SSS family solute:Na+ symporter
MFGSFLLILPVACHKYGGFSFLNANLPTSHLNWHGSHGAQYIIVWFFIALETLIEAGFYQRCFAAKTPRIAQRGIFFSIIFWIFFDFLTTFTGLYARASFPHLEDPMTSYLVLSQQLLPPIVLGFFLIGLLATVMSTIDSYTFLAAITFGRDFIWRLKKAPSTQKINQYTRIGLVFSGVLAIVIAYYAQSIIRIWKDVGSIGTPALVIPVVTSFFPRLQLKKGFALLSIVGSAVISAVWVGSPHINGGNYFFDIEPIYPGLAFSVVMLIMSHYRPKPDRL